jgi:transaldolase
LLDSGDPAETASARELLGFLDGQTTNPSLVARDPEIVALIASGKKMTRVEQLAEYKKIVGEISPLVGGAGVSIEVYADANSKADDLYAQGREMFSWIPNAFVKFPCTTAGLAAAERSVKDGIRVNVTLCFSQAQAAAVYAATRGSSVPVYVSPFVGRLDDAGQNGMGLVKNILEMYRGGDGHVKVLVASVRSLDHLACAFALGADLITAPLKILEEWAAAGMPVPDESYVYAGTPSLAPIPYEHLNLAQPWASFGIHHDLTDQGIAKFVEDYRKTVEI